MKKLYNEYVRVPSNKKMAHKVFFTNIGISVVAICICLAAMSFTAYAYFTSSITSGNNTIVAGNYDTTVSTTNVMAARDGSYRLTNTTSADITYEFTITGEGTTSVGYCKVLVQYNETDAGVVYYTNPIATPNQTDSTIPNQRVLKIVVPAGVNAKVTITSEWGSYSGEANLISEDKLVLKATSTTTVEEKPTTTPSTNTESTTPADETKKNEETGTPTTDTTPATVTDGSSSNGNSNGNGTGDGEGTDNGGNGVNSDEGSNSNGTTGSSEGSNSDGTNSTTE